MNRAVRGQRRLPAAAGWVAALCLVVGCSSESASPPPDSPEPSRSADDSATPPTPTQEVPIEDGGPLTALPTCTPPPPGTQADVEGLLLPDGAVVTEVQDQGQLVSVRAYVEQTPIQVRQFYNDAPGLELFEIEDEIYEAEVLFGGGDFRSYVKAQAQCQQGSLLLVFVGPGDSGDLPAVGGG